MSYDGNKLVKLQNLKALAEKINGDFARESELEAVAGLANSALKSGKVEGNTVSLFTSPDQSGGAAFSFDFPVELVLDQAKTAFVPAFAWSEEAYPGSADPGLAGKPVMVLAVKGSDGSVVYSFMDMAKLVDTYSAKSEGKDASTVVEISGYEVDVKVNVSGGEGNQLQTRGDGLFVPAPPVAGFSASVGTAEAADTPYAGAAAGDRYLDFAFKSGQSVQAVHTYLPAGEFSVTKVDPANANGLSIGPDGLRLNLSAADAAGAMSAADKAKLDSLEPASDAEMTEMLEEVFGKATADGPEIPGGSGDLERPNPDFG